jgi:hypothetical protein
MRAKLYGSVIAMVPLVFSGCLADVLVSTAIQGELQKQQVQALTRQLNNAKDTKSEIEVNHAIQAYAGEHGRYPASLQDLVPDYFSAVPTKPDGSPYGYDPKTGKLTDAPAPGPAVITPAVETNEQKMARIRNAINQYGMAVGYYPPSIEALVPQYLPSVPLTANGARFIYDPQTGALHDPTGTPLDIPVPGGATAPPPPQQIASPSAQRGSGVGGSGLMAETMTGISIQNELNSMSSAGSSAAGGSARGNARAAGQAHDQRQQQVMDDLGL